MRRRDVEVGLVLFAVTAFATGVRTYSGPIGAGASIPAIASMDDGTWYLPVVAAAALGAIGAASYEASRRGDYAWVHGVTLGAQHAGRVASGMIGAVVCALTYWIVRLVAAAVSSSLNDADPELARVVAFPVQLDFVGRVSLVAVAAGAVGACIGIVARRPAAAVALAGALFGSLLPVFKPLATHFPGVVEIQSYLPGGAATTALESNAGLPTALGLLSLRAGRHAVFGVLILAGWAAALLALAAVRRSHHSSPVPSPSSRVVKATLVSTAAVVVIAAVLPPLARQALPWYFKPEWLRDTRNGSSSIDAVEGFVDALRRGESVSEAVEPGDPLWRPLREGTIDVASESEMQAPDVVRVTAAVGDGGTHRYTYEFYLDRRDTGWEVVRVRAARG